MVLNRGKTVWAPLWQEEKATQELRQFLSKHSWGNGLVGSFRMLGFHIRNTPDQPADWTTMQGKREMMLRTRLQRLKACPVEKVRVAVTEAFITAGTYGTAVKHHSAHPVDSQARNELRFTKRAHQIR